MSWHTASRHAAPRPRHATPRHAITCRAVPCRAMPCRADVVPIYSLLALVPAHPHGVRSSGSVLIGGWQSGQADRFSLSLPQLLPRQSFPPRASPRHLVRHLCFPPPFPPTVHVLLSLSSPPSLCLFLSLVLTLSFGLSSSPLKHTFRVFPLPRLFHSLPPFLCLSLCLFRPLRRYLHPSASRETHVPVATLVAVHADYRRLTLLPRRKIFMPMYRLAVSIAAKFRPRARSVFPVGITVNRTSHQYECSVLTDLRAISGKSMSDSRD